MSGDYHSKLRNISFYDALHVILGKAQAVTEASDAYNEPADKRTVDQLQLLSGVVGDYLDETEAALEEWWASEDRHLPVSDQTS